MQRSMHVDFCATDRERLDDIARRLRRLPLVIETQIAFNRKPVESELTGVIYVTVEINNEDQLTGAKAMLEGFLATTLKIHPTGSIILSDIKPI